LTFFNWAIKKVIVIKLYIL